LLPASLLHRTVLRDAIGLAAALTALALLLAPAPARASAVTNASINGDAADDVQFVTASASVSTLGPLAMGSASASADLASGTQKARTEGEADDPFGSLDADASSELTDVLFLTPDSGSPTSPVLFTLFMDLDGFLFVDGSGVATSPNLQLAAARAIAMLEISGLQVSGVSPASFTATRRIQASAGSVLDDSTTIDVEQNTTGGVDDAMVDVRLTATAMVTPNSGFNIRAFVKAESATEAAFSSESNLFQTAQLGVVVPDGYSLSSSSGVFLTVPEPRASAASALTAVALLAAVRRRLLVPVKSGSTPTRLLPAVTSDGVESVPLPYTIVS